MLTHVLDRSRFHYGIKRGLSLYIRWLWLAVLVLAGGCATHPPAGTPEAEPAWLEHRAALEALRDWQVQGRVALRTETEGYRGLERQF